MSPPKKTGALLHAPKENDAESYHRSPTPQLWSWAAEAERLAKEFRRTHQARHLQALARHLDGVFERLITGGSQL